MIFDDFCHGSQHKFTFAGKDDEFLICVFCRSDKFELIYGIDKLNSIARKYLLPDFRGKRSAHKDDFSEYKHIFAFRANFVENVNSPEFSLCYNVWFVFDILGSMTWNIQPGKVEITLYYNDKNLDVEIMPYRLNLMVKDSKGMLAEGWQPNFRIICSRSEPWVQDYF